MPRELSKCGEATENNKLESVFGTKIVTIMNHIVATASMTFRSIQTGWELSRCQENSQSVERQRRITSRRRFSRLGPSFRRSRVGAVRRRQQLSIPEFSLTLTAVALRFLLILVDPSQRCNRKTLGGPKTAQYFTFDFRWPKHYGVRLELKMNRSALTIPDNCHEHHKRCLWGKNLSCGEMYPYDRLFCGEVSPHEKCE